MNRIKAIVPFVMDEAWFASRAQPLAKHVARPGFAQGFAAGRRNAANGRIATALHHAVGQATLPENAIFWRFRPGSSGGAVSAQCPQLHAGVSGASPLV